VNGFIQRVRYEVVEPIAQFIRFSGFDYCLEDERVLTHFTAELELSLRFANIQYQLFTAFTAFWILTFR
jgi:hypothetical protein